MTRPFYRAAKQKPVLTTESTEDTERSELEPLDPVGKPPDVEVDQQADDTSRERVLLHLYLRLLCALCVLCGEISPPQPSAAESCR